MGHELSAVVYHMMRERPGPSRRTWYRDVEEVRKQWREALTADYDTMVAEKIEEQRLVRREAWAGWVRSQDPTEKHRTGHDPAGRPYAWTERQGRTGEPSFMDIILRTLQEECKLRGLYAPERIDVLFKAEAEEIAREHGMTVEDVLREAQYYLQQRRRHGGF